MKKIKHNFHIFIFLLSITPYSIFADKSGNGSFSFKVLPTTNRFEISTKKIKLTSDLVFPEISNTEISTGSWQHVSRSTVNKRLAGINGKCIKDIFQNDVLRLTREFWHSINKDAIAIRQKVTNLFQNPVRLKSLFPLKLNGSKSLVFQEENNAANWNVLIQKRLKNGRPSSIIPSDNEVIEFDPFVVFHANKENTPDLLIGYLSQMGHLAHFDLQFNKTANGVDFSSLIAECEFDGVLLPTGGERTSQWIYLKIGFNPNKLIAEFVDKVGVYHGVKRPSEPAPSVFCTWYFHGRNYNEYFFMDDIKSLKENYMPFNVFLIDDCWANGNWGYWTTGDAFPSGMKHITEIMKESGYRPGIWTAPYSVNMESDLAKEHPEWLLRTDEDSLAVFGYSVKAWILDPTYPGVVDHLENVYRRLTNDYGFSYFKFDFMRSVFVYDNVKFYDPHKTRLEAYRMGFEAICRGVGPDSYISVCGGHFGGSLGIANSQRSGSDVVSIWEPKQIAAFRQNILRTWMSRLWHVDPDALMIRKREQPYHDPENRHSKLALGKLTDEEALTFTLNQYVGGGMVCFSEYMQELQSERRKLYRHIIPSINTPSVPLDIYNTFCPSMMLTKVKPKCKNLEPWNTIAYSNWEEDDKKIQITLSDDVTESLKSEKLIVSEFFSQKVLDLFSKNEKIDLGFIQPHHSRLLRIAPWDGENPVLVGTDLHFSGGGVEIEEWNHSHNSVDGKIKTEWNYPVKVSVAFPADNSPGYVVKITRLPPGQRLFYIKN